ncbi:peptide ABC transporter ATP-binding protein [Pseudoroseomonas rhizosphaerae]|uniref:Peptide ABC transporter ATP-binding protein n=1 Tax=Teichococcus rhizosphaerae TaxID=1335062 RepID=A0A2C6Y6T8_9PROT|nr:ABC transporter ATP-binding protein [Pseudoroseomonas rhizosphaerae]PHK96532.1 peptide ABC transporter ATP-binding protein [Pseudoroseomonas rhizosphaerae]
MSELLLDVENLTLGFRTERGLARILDGASLRIAPGQVMGLVGESGCGKTTLARAILGVLPAGGARIDGGSIAFRGRDLLREDPAIVARDLRGRAITFIPQDPFSSFNPVFTIGDQMMDLMKWKSPRRKGEGRWPALLQPYPRARRRADMEAVLEMLAAVQLPNPRAILRKYPHEVSGGQRQRLMIAMALLPEPDLVIADEPTTALDVTIQAQILGVIRRLATERRVAVLLTTHDLGSAWEICDAVTVMYAGQDVESAPIDAFFAAPAHPYTTRLLESLPRAPEEGGAADVGGIPGEVPSPLAQPAGCRFHPRCDRATEACRVVRPEETQLAAGHRLRCYHPRLPA